MRNTRAAGRLKDRTGIEAFEGASLEPAVTRY
jgi:hypothetical protein